MGIRASRYSVDTCSFTQIAVTAENHQYYAYTCGWYRRSSNLIGEGLSSAALANPFHILLSHQHPQSLAYIWGIAKFSPATGSHSAAEWGREAGECNMERCMIFNAGTGKSPAKHAQGLTWLSQP